VLSILTNHIYDIRKVLDCKLLVKMIVMLYYLCN